MALSIINEIIERQHFKVHEVVFDSSRPDDHMIPGIIIVKSGELTLEYIDDEMSQAVAHAHASVTGKYMPGVVAGRPSTGLGNMAGGKMRPNVVDRRDGTLDGGRMIAAAHATRTGNKHMDALPGIDH